MLQKTMIYPLTPSAASSRNRKLALAAICFAVLVVQIDTAIVNLGVRPLGEYFNAKFEQMQWVIDSYNLVYATLLLSGGLLADLYGRRRMFLSGALVFTLGSGVCAAAPSVAALIAGRAIAGLGAALLIPASLAIVRVVWTDANERGRVLGAWAICNGLAIAVGPTLGGLLIRHSGWRSIFLVVMPFSLGAWILARLAIVETSDPQGRKFDAGAQISGGLALLALCMASIEAYRSAPLAAAAFLAACVALALFVRIERWQGEAALAPLDVFKVREFRGAALGTAGMTFAMYGNLFVLPLAWQAGGVLNTLEAGVALAPMALAYVAVAPCAGAIANRLGAHVAGLIGCSGIASGVALIGASPVVHSIAVAETGLTVAGVGMGVVTSPLLNVAVGSVAAQRSGTVASLINVARLTGACLGVAVMGAVFASQTTPGHGLTAAAICGATVQAICLIFAWRDLRPRNRSAAAGEQFVRTPY